MEDSDLAELVVLRSPTLVETLDLAAQSAQDERAQEVQRRSDRMAATAELASCIAHEVNNPAAYVSANLFTMGQRLAELERTIGAAEHDRAALQAQLADLRQLLDDNLEGMGRITSIIRCLKDFSQVDEGSIENVNLNEVVNAACNVAYNQIRHRARLIKDLGTIPVIAGDPAKLKQLVLNLIMNAAEAIEEGAAEEHFVEVHTSASGGNVRLVVSDSGPGIPEALRQRVLEPFFSTRNCLGLGLPVAVDIARQHRGALFIESGPGTRVEVILPEETGLVVKPFPRREQLLPAPPPTGGRRVLLIDDEQMLLKAYTRILGTSYDVVTASGGREALELLRYDPNFDAVLCDLMMPQIDGPTIYHELESFAPHLIPRVIFCSGGAFTARVRSFAGSVPNELLEKPVVPETLRAAVARVVGV